MILLLFLFLVGGFIIFEKLFLSFLFVKGFFNLKYIQMSNLDVSTSYLECKFVVICSFCAWG